MVKTKKLKEYLESMFSQKEIEDLGINKWLSECEKSEQSLLRKVESKLAEGSQGVSAHIAHIEYAFDEEFIGEKIKELLSKPSDRTWNIIAQIITEANTVYRRINSDLLKEILAKAKDTKDYDWIKRETDKNLDRASAMPKAEECMKDGSYTRAYKELRFARKLDKEKVLEIVNKLSEQFLKHPDDRQAAHEAIEICAEQDISPPILNELGNALLKDKHFAAMALPCFCVAKNKEEVKKALEKIK